MNLEEHLRKLEEALLDHEVRKDASQVSALLTDNFREFGSSGRIFTRDAIIASLQGESSDIELTLEDFEVSLLSDGVALSTCRVKRSTPGEQAVVSLRSSIWIHQDEKWRMVFHQGTRVPAAAVQVSVQRDGSD